MVDRKATGTALALAGEELPVTNVAAWVGHPEPQPLPRDTMGASLGDQTPMRFRAVRANLIRRFLADLCRPTTEMTLDRLVVRHPGQFVRAGRCVLFAVSSTLDSTPRLIAAFNNALLNSASASSRSPGRPIHQASTTPTAIPICGLGVESRMLAFSPVFAISLRVNRLDGRYMDNGVVHREQLIHVGHLQSARPDPRP